VPDRVMAFSEGMLTAILEEFGDSLDVLLGRPMPVEGARRVLARCPGARRVHWLVDTPERMASYASLADARRERLDVAVEIDVGMRRGGALDSSALLSILQVLEAHPDRLRFSGFMGYDGHVPAAQSFGFDADTEFAAVHARYDELVRAGARANPRLFGREPIYNSGGSGTYFRYTDEFSATPVNDVALGSAFLLPADFDDLRALGHLPASFLASPVLKKIDPAEVPFALGYLPSLAESNPSLQVAFFMVGASFPGDIVAPEGLVQNPFIPGAGVVRNLLPNQMLMNGSRSVPLSVGDFVFHRTWEGDGLAWLRGGAIAGEWETFREGAGRRRHREAG
jgi:Alanine racemase, N-terminal domain